MTRARLACALALAFAVAATLVAGSASIHAVAAAGENEGKPAASGLPVVSVVKSDRREVVETVAVTGTLAAREEVLVGPEIEGLRIVEILADEGQQVAKGQVLVRLSRATLDAQLAQSDAALARADATIAQTRSQISQLQANVTLANAELQRAQTLLKRGASTQALVDQRLNAARGAQAQLDATRNALAAAQAEKANLEAQRRELMVRIERTDVRAPAGGLVSRRNARLGAVASAAGEPLFRIIADGKIELDSEVPEQRLGDIKPGYTAIVTLADGTPVKGEVRLVSPEVDRTTRLGHVRIALEPNRKARIGSFARGTIELRRSHSVSVPASAVIYGEKSVRVQVVANGAVKERTVRLGVVFGERAEILSGLDEGETVIVRAGPFLRAGDAIRPVLRAETN